MFNLLAFIFVREQFILVNFYAYAFVFVAFNSLTILSSILSSVEQHFQKPIKTTFSKKKNIAQKIAKVKIMLKCKLIRWTLPLNMYENKIRTLTDIWECGELISIQCSFQNHNLFWTISFITGSHYRIFRHILYTMC